MSKYFCFSKPKTYCDSEKIKTVRVIPHDESAPTQDDINVVKQSWLNILTISAAGYILAKQLHEIDETTTPIVFFYNTFFSIWKRKSEFVIESIYRNNIKIKSSSMIAMISFMIKFAERNIPQEEMKNVVKAHGNMGIKPAHYYLMKEVILETLEIVLNETEDSSTLVSWRKVITHSINFFSKKSI
jgi:hemoglobin-like flavoprotein